METQNGLPRQRQTKYINGLLRPPEGAVLLFIAVAFLGRFSVDELLGRVAVRQSEQDLAGLQAGWLERYEAGFNIGSILAAVACGVFLTWFIARDPERHEYLLASIGELRKVQWPDWEHTKKLTMIVCVVVAIFSVVLTVFDLAWTKILKLLLVA